MRGAGRLRQGALAARARRGRRLRRAHEVRDHRRPRGDERRVVETMRDLRANGVDVVTIGQYLSPRPSTPRSTAGCTRTSSAGSASRARRSASARCSPARSSAPRTARTSSATAAAMVAAPSRTSGRRRSSEALVPAGTYLNTATYGLPAQPTWDAVQAALEDWHHGRTSYELERQDRQRAGALRARQRARGGRRHRPRDLGARRARRGGGPGRLARGRRRRLRLRMFPFMAQADRGSRCRSFRSTGSPRRSTSAPTSSPRASYSRRRARCSTSTV